MRFAGNLNVDLNDITMNLVPFPDLHFLITSLSPLYGLLDVQLPPRRLQQMFSDAFRSDFQLCRADPVRSRYLGCGLLVRGRVEISDVTENMERIRPRLDFAEWNPDPFKLGLCAVPPVGQQHAMLTLANNCCFEGIFTNILSRYGRLAERQLYMHHYDAYMERSGFAEAAEAVTALRDRYAELQRPSGPAAAAERLAPIV